MTGETSGVCSAPSSCGIFAGFLLLPVSLIACNALSLASRGAKDVAIFGTGGGIKA